MATLNGHFYFFAIIVVIYILATIIFQGINISGMTLLLILCLSLWKGYIYMYIKEPPHKNHNIKPHMHHE